VSADQPNVPPMQAMPPQPSVRPPTWHTPIGVICIVFGALGALNGCFGLLITPFMGRFQEKLAETGSFPEFGYPEEWMPVGMTLSGVTLLVAGMLILVGARIVQRRRSAVSLARWWCAIKMVLVVATVVVQYFMMREQFDAMATNTPNAPPASTYRIGFLVGSIFGIAWGWALPLFLLIWFSREKIRAQVAEWPDRHAPGTYAP